MSEAARQGNGGRTGRPTGVTGRAVGALDERLGGAPILKSALRYVFPDHWSFMLGEIALYAFIVLVGTGIFLTFYYVPDSADVVYNGSYEPLQGRLVGAQYQSVLDISFDVPAGLLIRQTHHWAANLFLVAIVVHLVRILFTGAFRKPRELNYWIGVTLLGLAIFEGFLGYSLIDDLLSGMGIAIAYGVALAIPVVGADFAFLVWGGEYPGTPEFWPRLLIFHALIVPVLIGGLIAAHLGQITRQKHTDFPGRGRTERNVVGSAMWPAYALRSTGLLFVTTAVLLLIGGLIQVNPVWLWGPYEPYLSTNGAQPDWYVGWLIGALRIMPPLEVTIFDYTLLPNPFFGGVLLPAVAFAVLYAWPVIDKRWFGDRRRHELLDRPRDNPRRSAATAAFLSWIFLFLAAGATDRLYFRSFISYEGQIWFFRALAIVGPIIVYLVVRRVLEERRSRDDHPLRGWDGRVVVRDRSTGGFATVDADGGGAAGGAGTEAGDPSPTAPGSR